MDPRDTHEALPGLRSTLHSGETLFGAWLQLESPLVAEVLGAAGFDWVGIDTQHGLIGYPGLLAMLQALSISGTPALVRVSTNSAAEIGRALDAGAQGVIIPLVETAEQAARAVAACRYAPEGSRSWGPLRPAIANASYGVREGNAHAACVVMVETKAGAENVEAIVGVEGVDGVLVGPADLSVSLGGPPSATLATPINAALVQRVRRACDARGIGMAGLAGTPADIPEYLDAGCRFVAVYRDLPSVKSAAATGLAAGRAAIAAKAD
jgi:4-hydroxy-2-oxoheptanedioate aldolase